MSVLDRFKGWETMMLALLCAIVALNSLGSPYFLSVGNFVNLFQLSIEKSIVALTMALVIIGGEIDLSVASVMGLAACVMAWTFHEGAPMPLAVLLALAAGVLAGLNNAFWIARVGLPSLAVTLAGLIGYRGVARILLEDRAIGGFPDWFNTLGQQAVIGPLTAAILIFFLLIPLVRNCPARLRRSAASSMSWAATFRRPAIPACGSGSSSRLCSLARPLWRRSPEFCMLPDWDRCAATWRRASNSTSSPPCFWEGSAFLAARAIWSASAFRSLSF